MKVLFHILYHYWGKENRSLYRGLRYLEVRYIKVLLCLRRQWSRDSIQPDSNQTSPPSGADSLSQFR